MKKLLLILVCILISAKGFSQRSMNITYANDTTTFNNCPYNQASPYEEFTFRADLTGYSLSDTFFIKAFFGDGTYQARVCYAPQTVYFVNGQLKLWNYFDHQYLTTGPAIYDVTYVISDNYGNSDTLIHPAEVFFSANCSSLKVNVFVDNNSNCIYDAGDSVISNAPMSLFNGVANYGPRYLTYPYSEPVPLGVNYTAVIDPVAVQQLGYTFTCPLSGMINFTSSGNDTLFFAVSCNANYDLGIEPNNYARYKLNNSSLISFGVTDISCVPKSGSYSINFDPKLNFVYALIAPSSNAGNTYTWNFSNLSTIGNGQGSIFNMLYCNLNPGVMLGDTICNFYSVTPSAGDINPVNNTVTTSGVVVSAFDPNYKEVSPKGIGANGYILPNTKLTYTIGFQNTGNDTAANVYVMDTLSMNVDVNSIHVLYASHPMQLYIINGHILKFDFRNIQLPDSGANQMLSHGFIVYEITLKNNLATGTQIQNSADIYFDWNAPVITNTTLNTINTALGINQLSANATTIYPNPFTDKLNIDFEKIFDGVIELNDLSGRKIISENYSGSHFTTNLHSINPGIYVVIIRSKDGTVTETKKMVKL